MHKTVAQSFIIIAKYSVRYISIVSCFHLLGTRWRCLNQRHHKYVSDVFLLQSYHHYEVIWVSRILQLQSNLRDHHIHGLSLTEGSEGGPHYNSTTRAQHCPQPSLKEKKACQIPLAGKYSHRVPRGSTPPPFYLFLRQDLTMHVRLS